MNPRPQSKQNQATYNAAAHAVVIDHLKVNDNAVVGEAMRWSQGRRGPAVTAADLDGADLTHFVTQALAVGAHAITQAGGTQETFELERLVADMTSRTETATISAAEATQAASKAAAEAVAKASSDARKVITETEAAARKAYAETVAAATTSLRADVERLVGGENPELMAKLGHVLESMSRKLNEHSLKQTDDLLRKVSRQFDPADPTSPFAKQAKSLADQQQQLTSALEKNHLSLVSKVDELTKAVAVQKAAAAAAERTASATPLKGRTFEDTVNAVLADIAAGLGDDYTQTGSTPGELPGCKKGDGVLTIEGGEARVVIEMHDSSGGQRSWTAYLDEAERNRSAAASIGIVPSESQNQGQVIRVLGPRRMVVAYDPANRDFSMLRAAVQLMRVSARTTSARYDLAGLKTAQEHLEEATALVERIAVIRRCAGTVRKSVDAITKECNSLETDLTRTLGAAEDALTGVASSRTIEDRVTTAMSTMPSTTPKRGASSSVPATLPRQIAFGTGKAAPIRPSAR